jgi:hypothetical protein
MAGELEDATVLMLRQIQATLADHTLRFDQIERRFDQVERRFEQVDGRFEQIDERFEEFAARMDRRFERMQGQMDYRFDKVDRQMTDLLDNTIKASGEASVALVRHGNVQRQFAEMELELRDLKERLRKLEERV